MVAACGELVRDLEALAPGSTYLQENPGELEARREQLAFYETISARPARRAREAKRGALMLMQVLPRDTKDRVLAPQWRFQLHEPNDPQLLAALSRHVPPPLALGELAEKLRRPGSRWWEPAASKDEMHSGYEHVVCDLVCYT